MGERQRVTDAGCHNGGHSVCGGRDRESRRGGASVLSMIAVVLGGPG